MFRVLETVVHPFLRTLAMSVFACSIGVPIVAVADGGTIVVGQVVDQHGSDLESSRDYVIGSKLYFDYVNSQGGLGPMRVKQVVRDSGGDAEEALRLSRVLVEQDGATVLFGFVGEDGIRAVADSDLLTKYGVALVSPLTGLQNGNETAARNVFVTRASYAVELQKIVEYFQTISVKRFAVVSTRKDLTAQLVPGLKTAILRAKGTVVFDLVIPNPNDMPGAVKRVEAGNVQVVILLGDGVDLGLFAKLISTTKVGIPVVGLSLANHRVVVQIAGGADATGIMISQVVPNPIRGDLAISREHLAFMKRYLDEPPSHLTLEGFIAAKALVEVLRDASRTGKLDRQSVIRALRGQPVHDIGGVVVEYGRKEANSTGVDLTMVRGDGTLLH